MTGGDAKLFIFDCDGVLVDSEPLAAAALAETLTAAGIATTVADCMDRYTGLALDNVVADVEERSGRRLPADFRRRLRERDYVLFRTHLRSMPGVERILARLAAPVCIASSGSLEKLDVTLGSTGLRRYFAPNIFSAEQVERGKPHPDLFLFAAERMGVAPGDCVVIEDSVAGVRAACAAGMRVVGYTGGGHAGRGYGGGLRGAGATTVVATMDELGAVLT